MSKEIRQKLYDLMAQRADLINAAEAALTADNQEEYRANMDAAKALNSQLDALQGDLAEAERYDKLYPPCPTEEQGAAPQALTVDNLKGLSAEEINKRWKQMLAQSE